MTAADGGDLEIYRCVLRRYTSDLDAKDERGQTALLYAVAACGVSEHDQIALDLVRRGADVNALSRGDPEQGTAFMWAVNQTRHPELIRAMIAHGAQVNLRRPNGQTALSDALVPADGRYRTEAVRSEVIRILRAAGARK
jgi:ankyrin repeat protein